MSDRSVISCSISRKLGNVVADQVEGLPEEVQDYLRKLPVYREWQDYKTRDKGFREVLYFFCQGTCTFLLLEKHCHYLSFHCWGKRRTQVTFRVAGIFKGHFVSTTWATTTWNLNLTRVKEDRLHTPERIITVQGVVNRIKNIPRPRRVKVILETSDGHRFTKRVKRD